MKLAAFEAVAAALQDAGVRYLVAGGIAVNAHGYLRLTYDVDLVIQLQPANIQPAFKALQGLGYRPTVPVTAEQFADPAQRGATAVYFHATLTAMYQDGPGQAIDFTFDNGVSVHGLPDLLPDGYEMPFENAPWFTMSLSRIED